MANKYHAYVTPSAVGVSTDWNKVGSIVTGTKSEQHKSFTTYEEAARYVLSRLSDEDKYAFGLNKNPFFPNKVFVRQKQFIENKEIERTSYLDSDKPAKFYAVITPYKVGVFKKWYKANELMRATSKGKINAFSDFDAAEGYLFKMLSDKDYDDFGFNNCPLYVNKAYGRRSVFIAKKALDAAVGKKNKD